jgi:acetyl-CoA carboxylase alpha subunit
VICEPPGGAHRDKEKAIELVGLRISEELNKLLKYNESELIEQRHEKFRNMGNTTIKQES